MPKGIKRQTGPKSVVTYQDRLEWLVLNIPYQRLCDAVNGVGVWPSAARLLLDLEWINEGQLRRDLRPYLWPDRYGERQVA